MKRVIFTLGILLVFACSKTEVPVAPPTPVVQEEAIKFTTNLDTGTFNVPDTLPLVVKVSSKLPNAGILYSILISWTDSSKQIYKLDTSLNVSSLSLNIPGLKKLGSYSLSVTVTSKSNSTNSFVKTFIVNKLRAYKNYIKTSYELSNFDQWISSNDLLDLNGNKYRNNPLIDQQSTQIDIDGDGQEDIYYYEGYDLNINPTPNPPPSIFMNNGTSLRQIKWSGPNIKDNHGAKVMIGDFNNDSLPDILSVVAVDQPNGVLYPLMNNNCHLVFNSKQGFNKVLETDLLAYWHTGCSGDIDNDGDLDILIFNQHQSPPIGNNVKNRMMINDGKGNFSSTINGIEEIAGIGANQSELYDINNDGYLDLLLNYVTYSQNRENNLKIFWGNGKGFYLNNTSNIAISGNLDIQNIDFAELNSDNLKEIIISGYNSDPTSKSISHFIYIYKSDNRGKSFTDQSLNLIEKNITNTRFYHLRVQDIDKNGLLDLFSSEKKDNLRWEWNGAKFIKK